MSLFGWMVGMSTNSVCVILKGVTNKQENVSHMREMRINLVLFKMIKKIKIVLR